MKVISVDNFGRESVADILVKENLSPEEAINMAEKMNMGADDKSSRFYIAVVDTRRLWRGMEDLV